ncbi:MAG TPA: NGG1p interacting factor NIF3 [Candidatus Omnitrophota bacterium]|nr:NGG1p interacting factor NIF3 [Candidatus Omnitrophota bacterium]HPS20331.1 NGG1p interacting factor NIF3 [Candidatus Omnitrophota bacterium]
MKLREIYERGVKKSMSEDPRSGRGIKEHLDRVKKEYRVMKGIDRKSFDLERLKHPYDDSRILFGSGSEEIKTVMVGVDIDVSELLLADRLREKGVKIDLVISHHPSGRALFQLDKVMDIQPAIWEGFGIPKEIASKIMDKRMKEVARGLTGTNHTRVADTARILGIPFICMHTMADNCVSAYLQRIFDKNKPKKLKDVLSILKNIPEYRNAMKTSGVAPHILVGSEKMDAGKIYVDMTGGTNGPDAVFSRLSQSGVKTIVGMHIKEQGYNAVRSEFLNYVIAGHMASDVLGMNLLFDAIDQKSELEFIECSGFKRITRNK